MSGLSHWDCFRPKLSPNSGWEKKPEPKSLSQNACDSLDTYMESLFRLEYIMRQITVDADALVLVQQ